MECLKVFIVEDDQDIREVFELALRSEGYLVESFMNGREAIDRLRRSPAPCLILLDMTMPLMNGEEFMKTFNELPVAIVPIPVFLISAASTKQKSEEMGCRGFVKKPVNLDVLLLIVEQFCKKSRRAAA